MNILLAFDSFKESLNSEQAARCFKQGFQQISPENNFIIRSLSDGGEGFIEAIVSRQDDLRHIEVKNPIGEPIDAEYGFIEDQQLAVIEMAKASGLELIDAQQRDPLNTSSYGTGQLIQDALDRRAREICIGIGGSATVDGGCGMAQALGVVFTNRSGSEITAPITGGQLKEISAIKINGLHPECSQTTFRIACDVDNPLVGQRGAAAVFGPQKGADEVSVKELEEGLQHLAVIIARDLGKDIASLPGAGAAGGIGGMFHALLNAKLERGIDIVMKANQIDQLIQKADLVISGEGRIDAQTIGGKTVSGIVNCAKVHNKPVLAIGGSVVVEDIAALNEAGITAWLSLMDSPMDLSQAIHRAPEMMVSKGRQVAQLITCFSGLNTVS